MMTLDQEWFGLERYFEERVREETPSWLVHEDGECWALCQEFRFGDGEEVQRRVTVVAAQDWDHTNRITSIEYSELDIAPGPLMDNLDALQWLARVMVYGAAKSELRDRWDEELQWVKEVHAEYREYARLSHNQGRNAPCPCGSGKKYKRCCRRKKAQLEKELRQPSEVSLDSMASQWWEKAVENERFMALYDACSLFELVGGMTYDHGENMARKLGVAIEAVDEVGPLDDPRWLPESWLDVIDTFEEPTKSMGRYVLPLVAAHLRAEKAPWVATPQLYFSAVSLDYDSSPPLREIRFFWQDFQRWLAAVEDGADEGWVPENEFKEVIDRKMNYLLEGCRDYLDEDVDQDKRQEAMALLEEISDECHEVMPDWANEATIYAVAAYVSWGDDKEAMKWLEKVASRPVTRAHIPVYLGDLFLDYGMDWTTPQIELIQREARRYAEAFDGHQEALLERLDEALGELMESSAESR